MTSLWVRSINVNALMIPYCAIINTHNIIHKLRKNTIRRTLNLKMEPADFVYAKTKHK